MAENITDIFEFCVSLLLIGSIGLLYLGRRKHLPLLNRRGLRYGSYLKCPYCDQLIASDASTCPLCQRALNEIIMPVRAYRPGFEEKGEVLVCIRCGRLNNPNRTECKTCHTPLEKAVVPQRELPAPPSDDGDLYQL